MVARKKPLVQVIEEAFASVAPPAHVALGDDDDSRGLADAFAGKRWQDVPIEVLRDQAMLLPLFTPEAMRYYLPAFLRACAASYRTAGDIPGSLSFQLIPPRDPAARARFHAAMDPLSPDQRRAVRAFLEHMRDRHGDDDALRQWARALRQYW